MSLEGVPGRIYDSFQNHKMAVTVGVGTALVNALAPEAFLVHADDSLSRQARLALFSAIPVDEVTGNRTADIVTQSAFIAGTLVVADHELKRGTTTKLGLLGTAVLSQGAACGFDALADRTWLTPEEKKLPDVGNSSVVLGLLTKFALDHFPDTKRPWLKARQDSPETQGDEGDRPKPLKDKYLQTAVNALNPKVLDVLTREEYGATRQRLASAALGTMAVGATVGVYVVEGNQGGKLGMISHAAGIAAGALAHWLGKWFKAPSKKSGFAMTRADYLTSRVLGSAV
jgi:hypothetical protein